MKAKEFKNFPDEAEVLIYQGPEEEKVRILEYDQDEAGNLTILIEKKG